MIQVESIDASGLDCSDGECDGTAGKKKVPWWHIFLILVLGIAVPVAVLITLAVYFNKLADAKIQKKRKKHHQKKDEFQTEISQPVLVTEQHNLTRDTFLGELNKSVNDEWHELHKKITSRQKKHKPQSLSLVSKPKKDVVLSDTRINSPATQKLF